MMDVEHPKHFFHETKMCCRLSELRKIVQFYKGIDGTAYRHLPFMRRLILTATPTHLQLNSNLTQNRLKLNWFSTLTHLRLNVNLTQTEPQLQRILN